MTRRARFRCRNCGHRFEIDVLDEDEQRQAQRKGLPTSPIHCTKCKRTDVRDGWY